jgi:hypothetical protein
LKGIVLFLVLLFVTSIFGARSVAQDTASTNARASIYLEIGGVALLGSINLDLRITQFEKHNIGCKIGVGYPLLAGLLSTVNYYYGRTRHFLEIGAGGVYIPGIHPTLFIAYRFQCIKRAWQFRVVLTHVFMEVMDDDPVISPWAGVSVGFNLR